MNTDHRQRSLTMPLQVEVLNLQNSMFKHFSLKSACSLNSALVTCNRLHTLIATGPWPVWIESLTAAPLLQNLSINVPQGTSLLALAALIELRCRLWAAPHHACDVL